MIATSHPAPITVIVSIDTEEDNWTPARDGIALSNIRALRPLQSLFDRIGVRPTYFVSYQVARQRWAAETLREFATHRGAEIGAHLHPWNTPPLREPFEERNTMMGNLPPELQREKLRILTETIDERFQIRPRSFRAGRYGLGRDGVRVLEDCGYAVDSSVTPLLDWRRWSDGQDFSRAPLRMYRPSYDNLSAASPRGPVVEVPLSVGFTRRPFARWARWHERMRRIGIGPFSLAGLAYRSRFLRKVQLSFETDTVRDMLLLSRELVEEGLPFLHVTWHSPSMVPGLSPFVRTSADRNRLYADIERYFDALGNLYAISFATVTEAATRLAGAVVPVEEHAGHR